MAFLVVLLALGGIALVVYADAVWQEDAQAPLVFLVAPLYAALAYGAIAGADIGVRAIARRRSGPRS